MIWHWVLHVIGADNLSGPWYGFWSGFGSDIAEFTLLGAVAAAIRKHNCHVKGCRAVIGTAKDPEHGWYACKDHHSRGHLHGVAQEETK